MADVIVENPRPSGKSRVSLDSGGGRGGGYPLESDTAHMHPLVSWRSILAGLLVGFLCFSILTSLGMAFGGIGLDDGTTTQRIGLFTGIWFLVSSLVSLFVGSYFAARISKFHTNRLGSAQGLVIASLFFGFFLWQSLAAIGWAGRTAGQAVRGTASMMGSGVSHMADNPMVNNVVEDAVGDLNLRQDPQTIVTGIASRLIQGDVEGAKTYLSRQAPGVSRAEINQRIDQLNQRFGDALSQAREGAATALKATGWSVFVTLLLGAAASIGGGALGSRANLRKPLTREQEVAASEMTAAPV